MIKSHKLSLMGIMEAKLRLDNVDNTVRHCFPPHWSVFHNAAAGCVARIVLGWDTQLFTVDLVLSDAEIMVVKLVTLAKEVFYVSCVYGHNSMVDRRHLWEAMRRGGMGHIKSKLDRVLINGPWLNAFSDSETTFLAPGIFYHSFILVDVLPVVRCKGPFKFFSFWMRHASFKEILKDSWLSPVEGSVRSTLYTKLKWLKSVLRDFNKNFYSGISTKVAHA
ncbi:hypothetical protein RHSIM_Rhsim11G0078900 [Rhododendron simsii]|uniref:Uncharacterized protein n=1 Tax=Rhododendron simsii TaxID=118357 RepID=A0A834LBE2_RHOSS|nr:hypothetical protein RHSIM_Rhsim11G0078900 [Rhododendron simsii]